MREWLTLALVLLMGFYGSSRALEPLYTLVSPNETLEGNFGTAVGNAGDGNNDGYSDVIVGATGEDPGSSPNDAGRAYVFSGLAGDLLLTLVSPNEQQGGAFGRSVAGAGDVNDDGFDDVVVGAPLEDGGADESGRAYVFNGQNGTLIHQFTSPNAESFGHFGWSVSWAGDVNNDGYDEVIVGAYGEGPGASPDSAGRAYVFDGATGGVLRTLVSPNEEAGGSFGFSVCRAGDPNNDDYDEVIVGAYKEDPQGLYVDGGQAYVFDGETGGVYLTLISPSSEDYGWYGFSVSQAGDVNHDNYDDVVVGSPNEEFPGDPEESGRAHIHSGQNGGSILSMVSPNQEAGAHFGYSVSGGFDVNNNGFDDVIIGAPWEDGAATDAGMAYIFSVPSLGAINTLSGMEDGGNFGFAVSGAGDVTNHLGDEVIVGAYREDPGTAPADGGRAYVYLPEPSIDITGTIEENQLELSWTACPEAYFYWVYGADNEAYFVPTFYPSFNYRLDVLDADITTWSSSNGIGDEDHNWTYVIIAVSAFWQEMCRTTFFGEHDFVITEQ